MSEVKTEAEAVAEIAKPLVQVERGELVAIQGSMKVFDTEQYAAGRNRARGTYQTVSFDDFKSFVVSNNTHAPVFVDHARVSATAILNMRDDAFTYPQGHCDYKAILQLQRTVAWSKLTAIASETNRFSQKDFAVFLEDWADLLQAKTDDGAELSARDTLHAVRNMQINASGTSSTTASNTSESRSAFDSVEAKSTVGKLPSYFEISDSCYVGLEPRSIKLRLIVSTPDGNPKFSIQIVKHELINEAITQEFKQKMIALLPENEVRIGTFSA